eukprot:c3992_g1_i1.p1 GENE.c3992_g1_i1~~c3992_g1_i1.p1  ORF type:complete len:546 (+),score=123.64 c3992_g1_i1:149-1639(+)
MDVIRTEIYDVAQAVDAARKLKAEDEADLTMLSDAVSAADVDVGSVEEVASDPPELDITDSLLEHWNQLADQKEAEIIARQARVLARTTSGVPLELALEENPPSPVYLKTAITVNEANQLGKGTYKTVFKETVGGVPRAVARIPKESYPEIKKEWFFQEAIRQVKIGNSQTCGKFVPLVVGVKRSGSFMFVVSELAEGDLDTHAKPKKTTAFEKWIAKNWGDDIKHLLAATQMAMGIKCVKAAGLVHRDIKPANFLVSADNSHRVLVNDFGLTVKRCRVGFYSETGIPACDDDSNELTMECCTTQEVKAVTKFDKTEYIYWPKTKISTLGASLDVYSLGYSFKEMLNLDPQERQNKFLGVSADLRSKFSDLADRMTDRDVPYRAYPEIDEVILDLLRMIREYRARIVHDALERVTELQEGMRQYLAESVEHLNADIAPLSRRYAEIKDSSIFLRRRWIRWCVSRDSYEEIEHLKAQIRAKQAEAEELRAVIAANFV